MAKPLVERELILAFDFDGTMTTNPDISDEPLQLQEDCADVLRTMWEDGIRLLLWTCRTGPALDHALDFLRQEGLLHLFEKINEHVDEVEEKYAPHVSRKLGFDVCFDDKNLGCSYLKGFTPEGNTIIDWQEIRRLIYGN